MSQAILTDLQTDVNISFTVPPTPGFAAVLIRGIISPKETVIERVYSGGVVDVEPSTVEAVQALEAQLAADGWQVTPSLWHGGFSARRVSAVSVPPGEIRKAIPFMGEPIPDDDDELIFASSADLWPDDYAIEAPRC